MVIPVPWRWVRWPVRDVVRDVVPLRALSPIAYQYLPAFRRALGRAASPHRSDGDLTRGNMVRGILALGQDISDGFGGPTVTASMTASRFGHCHPSLTNTGPCSGGRWGGLYPAPAL